MLTVRQAHAADAGAIAGILAEVVATVAHFATTPPTPDEVAADLAAPLPWLVATLADEVVGTARASRWKPRDGYARTCESSVHVAAAARGHGVGHALLGALLGALRRTELRMVLAGIAQPNPASVALHERHGFRHVGTLPNVGHKLDRWIDVGYWALDLRPELSRSRSA